MNILVELEGWKFQEDPRAKVDSEQVENVLQTALLLGPYNPADLRVLE